MLSKAILFNKSLIRFVLLRVLFLAIAFSVGFNSIMVSDFIQVPDEIRKLFMHNWGYLLLSYALLIYIMGLVSLLATKGIQVGFRGMAWATVFHALGSLIFLGRIGRTGLIIGGICYTLALILIYLWENSVAYVTRALNELSFPPSVHEWILSMKRYLQGKPSAPFIILFMVLLVICAFLLVFKLEKLAEHLANIAYFALVIGVGIEVYQLIKAGGREEDHHKDSGHI